MEFAAGRGGNARPVRKISGSHTDLFGSTGVALDRSGNIFVSEDNAIVIFGARAKGDAPPKRVIWGEFTLLKAPNGIAVDDTGIYVGSCKRKYIERFKRNADGNVPPSAIILGPRTTIRACVNGLAVDGDGTVYATTFEPRILGFRGLSDGNVKPAMHLAGTNTALAYPRYLYVRTPRRTFSDTRPF